jgi:hypothetical protein
MAVNSGVLASHGGYYLGLYFGVAIVGGLINLAVSN